MSYCLYILESLLDGSYYVGSTQDLQSRIERHNEGRVKYTRAKRPWKIAYFEKHPDRSSAMKREYAVKSRKSKAYIDSLIRTSRSQSGKVTTSSPVVPAILKSYSMIAKMISSGYG